MIDIEKKYEMALKQAIQIQLASHFDTGDIVIGLTSLKNVVDDYKVTQHKPTAEEVRKAIEDEIDWNTKVIDNQFYFINGSEEVLTFLGGRIKFNFSPSPKLAIMIAKFYEVEE